MWIERAAEQERARAAWLKAAVERWAHDDDVAAVWLWGSEGLGTADALSDFDLFVALRDHVALENVGTRIRQVGEPLRVREVPHNAPEAGRYFSVGYPGPLQPIVVDWYWQPASRALIGTDTRILLEKAPLPRAGEPTFRLFPNVRDEVRYQHPDDPAERLEGLLDWFWGMYGPITKKAARGQHGAVEQQSAQLRGVISLAAAHVGVDAPPADAQSPSVLREMADTMRSLHLSLSAHGVAVPDTSDAYQLLAMLDGLTAEGWSSTGGRR